MKPISLRPLLCAVLLMAACGGAAPLPLASRLGQEPAPVAAAGVATARPIILPTNAQVLAAVAAAVYVRTLPPPPPIPSDSRFGCMAFYAATTAPACVRGDPEGSHTIVLYGDSHAANWIAAFDTFGMYLHWRVVELTKALCQVPDFPTWNMQEQRPYTECAAFRSFALARIRQIHPDVVVLSSQGQGPYLVVDGHPTRQGLEAAWAAGLARVIDAIEPATGKVVVLGDFAYGVPAGGDCLPIHADDIRACNLPRSRAVDEAHNQMEQRIAQQHGALYVSTVPWFCTATVCPAVVAGLSTRNDGFHVSPTYALWLSAALASALGLLPGGAAWGIQR